jgi:hypothetical protein
LQPASVEQELPTAPGGRAASLPQLETCASPTSKTTPAARYDLVIIMTEVFSK